MAPKKVNKVKTVAFVNPRILDSDGNVIHKSGRGWGLTNSDKYPMNKFDQMLVDLATEKGGSVTLDLRVSVNLNMTDDKPLDHSTIPTIDD